MREILFRGKSKNSGRWVYGDLVLNKYSNRQGTHIYEKNNSISCPSGYQFVRVDKNTIGQYTGTDDIFGIKIFEGDILREKFKNEFTNGQEQEVYYFIKFTNGMFATYYYDFGEEVEDNRLCKALIEVDKLEVVGNIYDTPQLL